MVEAVIILTIVTTSLLLAISFAGIITAGIMFGIQHLIKENK
jgi:hypothetical protein